MIRGRNQKAVAYTVDTNYRDDLGTPIYKGDTVLLTDHDGTRYLGIVVYDGPFGGWCTKLIAKEGTGIYAVGFVSMAGFAITQIRPFRQFRRRLGRRLRRVRVCCRGYTTLISNAHLAYAHGQ